MSIKASNNPFECTPSVINIGNVNIVPFRQVFDYVDENITLTTAAKVVDVENLTNPSKAVTWTVVDDTHITITSNCEVDDEIKIIGTEIN